MSLAPGETGAAGGGAETGGFAVRHFVRPESIASRKIGGA